MTYRPEIDGLRAIAVISVLLFHAGVPALSGGYVGVDVFFVISGYLITGIILDRPFSFLSFYGRRVRRIFPALILVLVCSLVAGWFILLPVEYEKLSKEVIASALFVPNFLFWSEAGYFDGAAIEKPLLHLWSLGIEEQFYLLWPIALLIVSRRRALLTGFLIAATAISFALCVHMTSERPSSAFYLPQFRAWELSLGALVAVAGPLVAGGMVRFILSLLGILAIAAAVMLFEKDSPFPGYLAAIPTLGTAAAIWASRGTLVSKALSFRPIVYIGLISYPLYLWHWPLLSFAHYLHFENAPIVLLASFGLAVLTYELVEKPIRKRGPIVLVGGMALAASCAAAIIASDGYSYHSASRKDVAAILATMKYDYATDARMSKCWLLDESGPQQLAPECFQPDNGVLLWGDSQAARLYPGLQKAFPDIPIWQATRSSCPVFGGQDKCNHTNAEVRSLIAKRHPHTVIVFAAWVNYSDDWSPGNQYDRLLRYHLSELCDVPNVIVIGPAPTLEKSGLPQAVYETWKATRTIPDRYGGFKSAVAGVDFQIRAIVASFPNAKYVSPHEMLCNEAGCLVHVPDRPSDLISYDYGHLTTDGGEFISLVLLKGLL